MTNIDYSTKCPACQNPLRPKILGCDDCGVKVEGPFQLNEFATLGSDDLHFLRIFVRCEGRIRDMETALGLSYPTIRTRLTDLKNKLVGDPPKAAKAQIDPTDETAKILEQLQAEEISFKEAMKQIKKIRSVK